MAEIRIIGDQILSAMPKSEPKSLPPLLAGLLVLATGLAHGVAFAVPSGGAAILIALPCLCMLARVRTAGQAFLAGAAAGLAMYVPHLWFFWSIFGPMTVGLWIVVGLPIGVFVLLLHWAQRRAGNWAIALAPMFWMAVEYFRSEVWYLRFAWLVSGQAPAFLPGVRLERIGVYGLGFIFMLAAAMMVGRIVSLRIVGVMATIILAVLMYVPALPPTPDDGPLHVAGVQLEGAGTEEVVAALDRLALAHPEAQILVLSEYTFHGPVPQEVREVVRAHHRYLIAGGTRRATSRGYYDTAFVIGPDGLDLFAQGKSVPVQFMNDGFPAAERHVWNSPWGKIGIAICYDMGYARAMDDFVREGAQGLIIPTMDLADWGEYERRMLHGRLAPVRAAEYGIPTFGLWSSGVSQLVDRYGRVTATAPYPGQGEMIAGPFRLGDRGHLPLDRWPAVASMVGTALFAGWLIMSPRSVASRASRAHRESWRSPRSRNAAPG